MTIHKSAFQTTKKKIMFCYSCFVLLLKIRIDLNVTYVHIFIKLNLRCHCISFSGFVTDKRNAIFLKIFSQKYIIISTFESTKLVMENISCLPIIVLCYNGNNDVQQSLAEVTWFNIPIHTMSKICAVLYYSLLGSMTCFMTIFER
jgi:hypothetical protein